jgi:hypothetical protein
MVLAGCVMPPLSRPARRAGTVAAICSADTAPDERRNDTEEARHRHGLRQEAHAVRHLARLDGIARDDERRQVGLQAAQRVDHFDAVHARHAEVGDEQVERPRLTGTDGVEPVVGDGNVVAGDTEVALEHVKNRFFVIDDEDAWRCGKRHRPACLSLKLMQETTLTHGYQDIGHVSSCL